MKIVFVSSGNSSAGITPIIFNQGNSLIAIGHQVEYFAIKGKGLKGYFNNFFLLRKFLKNNPADVVHAHYSLTAIIATFSSRMPLVVSLMGSDVKAGTIYKVLVKLFSFFFWKTIIVKSMDMKKESGLAKAHIIPNGVDFERFKPITKEEAIKITKWEQEKKHILFAANAARKEKNFALAEKSFELLNEDNCVLHSLENVPNEIMPFYLNSADVILLTSLWEGSPNVIKEAMACNRPIVVTNCGDVEEVLKGTDGCFVTDYNETEIAKKIKEAISYSDGTKGREAISYLDSQIIAMKLIALYKIAINKN